MSDFYDAEMAAKQERMARTKDMVRQRSELVRVLSPQSGEHILELGSGNGIFSRELMDYTGSAGRVVGLDSSEAMLEMARRICPNGAFELGDAQELPFEDSTFDVIVAAQLFCFLSDVDQALTEAIRVLKPGGRIVILDTDWDSLVWRNSDQALMDRVMNAYKAVYADAYLPRTLPERMARLGYSSVDVESFVVLNTNFNDDTYARQSAEFAISIMEAAPEFSGQEKARWLEDQKALDRAGGFFFSLNRYIITGTK